MVKHNSKGKIFYAEVPKAHIIKVMIDSLALAIPRATFHINKEGITHRGADQSRHILYDINLKRENFSNYICKKSVIFSVNLKHFQQMIRSVKKKNSMTLFIEKSKPDKLYIVIQSNNSGGTNKSRVETIGIVISLIDNPGPKLGVPEIYNEPEKNIEKRVYGHPKVIESSQFQKLKKMGSVGKIVAVKMQGSYYASFFCKNIELYDVKLEYGEIVEPDDDDEEDEDGYEIYEADFNMSTFTFLMKLPGLCSQMQFFAPKVQQFPLKISMKAGDLGTITVYIKDAEQIAFENSQNNDKLITI